MPASDPPFVPGSKILGGLASGYRVDANAAGDGSLIGKPFPRVLTQYLQRKALRKAA
jgi:hypothetical protein